MNSIGIDLVIPTVLPVHACMELVWKFLTAKFRDPVVDWEGLGKSEAKKMEHCEFLIYATREIKESWDKDGRTKDNAPGLYHVIITDGQVTVCHEDPKFDVAGLTRILQEYNDMDAELAKIRENRKHTNTDMRYYKP